MAKFVFLYRKRKYKLKVKIGKQKQILRIIAQGIQPCQCSTKVVRYNKMTFKGFYLSFGIYTLFYSEAILSLITRKQKHLNASGKMAREAKETANVSAAILAHLSAQ